jgi:hypothetical protein
VDTGRIRGVTDGCAESVRTRDVVRANLLVSAMWMQVCKTVGVVLRHCPKVLVV